ncbi:MAG TPA: hypothetical protein VKU38_19745 [Ktedonobacteraceae bacterium]|nr:hypothetical protein [Ktedonobacteraceae bacterium]
MKQSIKNASPEVKAALVGGIFVIIAAIIAATAQLIIKQQQPYIPTSTPIIQKNFNHS